VINYVLIKNNISIANYTGYINVPMLSFQKLINYSFVFSTLSLLASGIAFFIDKKGIVFSKITNSKLLKGLLFIVLIISTVFFVRNALRFIAADSYYKAALAFSENKIDETKNNLNRAVMISPFDEYYLAKNEILNVELNALLNSQATNTAELQQKYKVLVESQIYNANKAVSYDKNNPRNYMALGTAYERSILLSKEDGYTKSIAAYDKARELANDKDYVDVVKAKASFGVEKEVEALNFIDNALRYNSSSSPALFISSQYYASKNNLATAIEYGEKAVITSPQAVDARLSLGLLYLQDKKYDAAIQMFGTVLQLTDSKNLGAIYYLGLTYKAKGDDTNLNLVISELEKTIDPNSREMQALKSK
jgi:predicted Zn-dependent protease